MSNLVRYQNEIRTSAKGVVREKMSCGRGYPYKPSLHIAGGHKTPEHHNVWVPDGEEITDTVSINTVNGQLVATSQEDDYIYFWVSGARGAGHNGHKKLLLPPEVELLAAGSHPSHTPGNCNKITSAIFRVPKGATRVFVGDFYCEEYSQAIIFTCSDGEWVVTVEPYERFCATNPEWTGLWTEDEPPLPLPALVE